jgi:hypothetical protein
MRRASIVVLLLTFLALVAGTLAVPARSAGLVWTVTPSVVQTTAPTAPLALEAVELQPSGVEFPNAADDGADAEAAEAAETIEPTGPDAVVEDGASEQASVQIQTSVTFAQTQGTVALGLGQPDLHWQPLWKVLWPAPEPAEFEVGASPFTSSAPNPTTYTVLSDENWTVDKKAWALQLGLILALGGLLVLALRIIAARREANRDLIALAAR